METNKTTYLDMLGFIRHTFYRNDLDDSKKLSALVSTLGHDLNGLINEDPFFSPRVTGYRKSVKFES